MFCNMDIHIFVDIEWNKKKQHGTLEIKVRGLRQSHSQRKTETVITDALAIQTEMEITLVEANRDDNRTRRGKDE